MIRASVCLRACSNSRWTINVSESITCTRSTCGSSFISNTKTSIRLSKPYPAQVALPRFLSSSTAPAAEAVTTALASQDAPEMPSRPWRVLFFGTDHFSLSSLQRLHENRTTAGISHIEVVTTPDQTNSKRKRDGASHVIKDYCLEQGIKVHEAPVRPRRGNGSGVSNSKGVDIMSNKIFRPPVEDWRVPLDGFDLGVVISFGLFLPQEIIQSFSAGCVNVHPSLLPRFRGAAPIQHTLLMDEKETGVSVINVHPTKFDCGNILAQERTNVLPQENYDVLLPRLADLGASTLLRTISDFETVWVNSSAQQRSSDEPRAPVMPSSSTAIDWTKHSASQVFNMWRAFGTKPGIRTVFKNKVVRLLQMTKPSSSGSCVSGGGDEEATQDESHQPHVYTDHAPGTILLASPESARSRGRGGLLVVCQDHQVVEITRLQFENKGEIQAVDFYNGHLGKMPQDKWLFA